MLVGPFFWDCLGNPSWKPWSSSSLLLLPDPPHHADTLPDAPDRHHPDPFHHDDPPNYPHAPNHPHPPHQHCHLHQPYHNFHGDRHCDSYPHYHYHQPYHHYYHHDLQSLFAFASSLLSSSPPSS